MVDNKISSVAINLYRAMKIGTARPTVVDIVAVAKIFTVSLSYIFKYIGIIINTKTE